VVLAGNGIKALQSMCQDPSEVVLLDIMMSIILDGLEVSREMSEDPALKEIPVIMVSCLTGVKGSGMFPTDEYVPDDEWLSKPVDPEPLFVCVDEVPA
jgi:CheY-like chemotaxis protein